jgi:hypothetical protein
MWGEGAGPLPVSLFIGKAKGFNEALVVSYAVQQHLWLQDNGLSADSEHTLPDDWHKVPLIAEQRSRTTQRGDTLQEDLQAALNEGATYIMIFASDIRRTENQSALRQVAALANA